MQGYSNVMVCCTILDVLYDIGIITEPAKRWPYFWSSLCKLVNMGKITHLSGRSFSGGPHLSQSWHRYVRCLLRMEWMPSFRCLGIPWLMVHLRPHRQWCLFSGRTNKPHACEGGEEDMICSLLVTVSLSHLLDFEIYPEWWCMSRYVHFTSVLLDSTLGIIFTLHQNMITGQSMIGSIISKTRYWVKDAVSCVCVLHFVLIQSPRGTCPLGKHVFSFLSP